MPRIFLLLGEKRRLLALAALALLAGAAMLPAMATMSDHGASLFDFESAGTVARWQEILVGWGETGESAMWWQLALDIPFIFGFSLFFAGACAGIARRARRSGKRRLERVATVVAWFGPVAGTADLLQDVSLALVLGGHVAQPWLRISAMAGPITSSLLALAAAFSLYGFLATRSGPAEELRPERP